MNNEAVEMSTADVRANLADVINAAAAHGRITYLTSRGRRIAAMVPLAIAEQAEATRRPTDGADAS
ncbi:type II toxin-antitoxin system prevent-host-death family antitoxin [Kitasatospora sp. NPDC048239]|uniref:type II toxin-antitoxin system prevent-host-death family antitoxin n=1 Tax=Kitasatospora sp. NPDC048239 TaxID=3364046 RepID=UPI003717D72F